ncbi:MAG TPA: hypothetical protein VL326_10905 [Kofleriaceae bacterium]|jgi:hypothetical protein|nr:hypothetical protein [Kofleriaceae bacterium]
MDALFAEMKALIEPYAKHFTVFADTADAYDLEEELPGYRTQFALRCPRATARRSSD